MRARRARTARLRQVLSERRREMQDQMHSRILDRRVDRVKDVRDDLEHSDMDVQRHVESAVLEMRAGTLRRIDQALVRLDAGRYGRCAECHGEISEQRLRALPFAVRCRACEDTREQEQGRVQRLAGSTVSLSLFPEALSS